MWDLNWCDSSRFKILLVFSISFLIGILVNLVDGKSVSKIYFRFTSNTPISACATRLMFVIFESLCHQLNWISLDSVPCLVYMDTETSPVCVCLSNSNLFCIWATTKLFQFTCSKTKGFVFESRHFDFMCTKRTWKWHRISNLHEYLLWLWLKLDMLHTSTLFEDVDAQIFEVLFDVVGERFVCYWLRRI